MKIFVSVIFVLCVFFSAVIMALILRRSLRKTLYTYTNIGLIGGILFLAVLSAAVIFYTVKCIPSGNISVKDVYLRILEFPRQFSFYAVFVITAIFIMLAISNIALIKHEGLRFRNILSVLIAVFYIGGTAGVYFISDVLAKKIFIERNSFLDGVFVRLNTAVPMFFLLMLCYFECIFAGCIIMEVLAAKQKPKYDKDFIIILGCSIDKKGGLLPLLKGRVNRAVRFAWEQEIATGKPLKFVPSGGQGANEIMSEGSAMELYLKTKGAEDDEVFPEKKSVNTFENMAFSKKIIDEIKPDAKIAFATTNYHMLRSGILARKAGIDAEGIAGDTKWYFWPNGFVREFFGILVLNKRAHFSAAAAVALVCTALCFVGV